MSLPKNATIAAKPFKISIPDLQLGDLRTLIRLSKLPPVTYEATKEKYGERDHEFEINKLPQYTAPVRLKDGKENTLHFIDIFSTYKNTIPLVLPHGWPGSFVEFLDLIPILAASTSPQFHIIVPSLPGYALSSAPPLGSDFTLQDCAYLVNELMLGLWLKQYVAQGGDIGSFIAEALAVGYPACLEKVGVHRGQRFNTTGNAYALEHATRPSTIGHVLSSSPLALLAWISEELRDWTDETPPIEKILEIVTLWWLTETMPRSIYAYRQIFIEKRNMNGIALTNTKFGYSDFPMELIPVLKLRVETLGEMVFFRIMTGEVILRR
ncbi:epoxide hydrolase [Morchella snyderi]|nr:epoxide hydrolase [Morchella snyderi]